MVFCRGPGIANTAVAVVVLINPPCFHNDDDRRQGMAPDAVSPTWNILQLDGMQSKPAAMWLLKIPGQTKAGDLVWVPLLFGPIIAACLPTAK